MFNINYWRAGDWHHVAYTWSNPARRMQLFVDGALRAEATVGADLPGPSVSDMDIGTDNGTNSIDAAIDELRISNTVRTAAEIRASAGIR